MSAATNKSPSLVFQGQIVGSVDNVDGAVGEIDTPRNQRKKRDLDVAYLCLISQAIGSINPDIFSEDLALLVQFHVFFQLKKIESAGKWHARGRRRIAQLSQERGLTLAALEMMVDSPSPGCDKELVGAD